MYHYALFHLSLEQTFPHNHIICFVLWACRVFQNFRLLPTLFVFFRMKCVLNSKELVRTIKQKQLCFCNLSCQQGRDDEVGSKPVNTPRVLVENIAEFFEMMEKFVALPRGIDQNEWIATHSTVFAPIFKRQLLMFSFHSHFCTVQQLVVVNQQQNNAIRY